MPPHASVMTSGQGYIRAAAQAIRRPGLEDADLEGEGLRRRDANGVPTESQMERMSPRRGPLRRVGLKRLCLMSFPRR